MIRPTDISNRRIVEAGVALLALGPQLLHRVVVSRLVLRQPRVEIQIVVAVELCRSHSWRASFFRGCPLYHIVLNVIGDLVRLFLTASDRSSPVFLRAIVLWVTSRSRAAVSRASRSHSAYRFFWAESAVRICRFTSEAARQRRDSSSRLRRKAIRLLSRLGLKADHLVLAPQDDIDDLMQQLFDLAGAIAALLNLPGILRLGRFDRRVGAAEFAAKRGFQLLEQARRFATFSIRSQNFCGFGKPADRTPAARKGGPAFVWRVNAQLCGFSKICALNSPVNTHSNYEWFPPEILDGRIQCF